MPPDHVWAETALAINKHCQKWGETKIRVTDLTSVLVQTIDGIEFIKRLIVNFDEFQIQSNLF